MDQGYYYVIHVAVGDKKVLLGDGALRAPANVKGDFERGEDHAGLASSN